MKQLFEQVFIKSESDLPKVLHETKFWAHTKSGRMIETNIAWTWRVNEIDWYLLPIDLSKECHCGGYPECICEISRKESPSRHQENDICTCNAGLRNSIELRENKCKECDLPLHPSQSELAMQPKQTAEEILFAVMYENNFTYVSFPAFIENESSIDVFDIACIAVEYAQLKAE